MPISVVVSKELEIADMNALKSRFPGSSQAAEGMGARCRGKVFDVKMWVEGQQAVGNFWIQVRDKPCECRYFSLINVSRYEQGAGYEKRRVWPFLYPFGKLLEIVQSIPVCYSAKGKMKPFIPCL